MNKWVKYAIIAGILIVAGLYGGYKIAGILSLAGLNEVRKDIKKQKGDIESKKEDVKEAENDIEEDSFDNADNAGKYVDDVLSDISTDE